MGVINSFVQANFSTGYQQLKLAKFPYIWSKATQVEQYFKFILYGVIFLIYLVSQVRKMRKKAEEEKEQAPQPVKEVLPHPVVKVPKKSFDYKGKREMKTPFPQKALSKKEPETVVYKPVADEELMAEANLLERKKEQKDLKKERQPLAEEHLQPYIEQPKKESMNWNGLKDKANLKRAFIAGEIFQRKY